MAIAEGSVQMPGEAVAYRVDTGRLDRFFDHLCWGIYFDRYGVPFNDHQHALTHHYLDLTSSDPEEIRRLALLAESFRILCSDFASLVESYSAAKIDEIVYQNKIIDPARGDGSITIAHTFYRVFNVVSLLTRRPPHSGAAA